MTKTRWHWHVLKNHQQIQHRQNTIQTDAICRGLFPASVWPARFPRPPARADDARRHGWLELSAAAPAPFRLRGNKISAAFTRRGTTPAGPGDHSDADRSGIQDGTRQSAGTPCRYDQAREHDLSRRGHRECGSTDVVSY